MRGARMDTSTIGSYNTSNVAEEIFLKRSRAPHFGSTVLNRTVEDANSSGVFNEVNFNQLKTENARLKKLLLESMLEVASLREVLGCGSKA